MSDKMVERYEDMSPTGRLRLIRQQDGDIIVAIEPTTDARPFERNVEFCTRSGGGQSMHTLRALIDLFKAMERDNIEREQYRGTDVEKGTQ